MSSPFVSALSFSLDYKALWRVDGHRKHRPQISQRYTENSLNIDLFLEPPDSPFFLNSAL